MPPATSNPTQPQSWSSYLLSTYSTSVSPTHDPDQYAPTATPISPSLKPASASASSPTTTMSPSTSTSPWGPYTKSGRGGFGNFIWQSQLQSSQSSTTTRDPESNPSQPSTLSDLQKAAAELEAREQADVIINKSNTDYARTGRGGAGNFVTPSPESAPAEAQEPPPRALPMVDPYLAARSGYYGRGGAGNYNWDEEKERKEREEEEERKRRRKEEELQRLVEESVGIEMRRPEGVVIREGREREKGREEVRGRLGSIV